ncbi:MAG: type I-B CRISPR-associated protein Cas8b1/Cst1 [Candidatus Caldarchaeum sp.]
MSEIVLYPSNWLYNAGVVGLLTVQKGAGEQLDQYLQEDGTYRLPEKYFESVQIEAKKIPRAIVNLVNTLVSDEELSEWRREDNKEKKEKYKRFEEELDEFGFRFIRAGNKLFASKTPYQNLVQLSEWQSYEFSELVGQIPNLIKKPENQICDLCRENPISIPNSESKLQLRLTKLQSTHLKGLGPSLGEFPNSFWNMNQSMNICFLCAFLIIHHHLAFTRLSDGSEIFINAPSFKVMYYLNRFAQEAFGVSSSAEARTKREILAMSVIEYATKIQATLGVWTGMNIEIVSRRGSEIEFFSLPHEVIQLLADRRIASLLSQIGEFSILNNVLNQHFSPLMELGYRLLRIGVKPYGERGKPEISFVNENLRLDKNRQNPQRVAEQIFQLCAFIEEKRKRREIYEYIGTT